MATTRGISFLTGIECDFQREPLRSSTYFWDPVCGVYGLADDVKLRLEQNISDKRRLTYALAARVAHGSKRAIFIVGNPTVISMLENQLPQWTLLTTDDLLSETPVSPLDMLDGALLNLTRKLNHPSELARVSPEDCWTLYAHDSSSLKYISDQLCGLGYIKDSGSDPSTSYRTQRFEVQSRGWEKVATMTKADRITKRQAFVAMWFNAEMNDIYNHAIRVAIEEDGTKAVRIDLKEHNNKICDEIILEIRRSKYVVADFSGDRAGVYYEAGFAHGIGIPVIWTVRKPDLDKLHFDTRQYNHLVYETPAELRQKLANRIKARGWSIFMSLASTMITSQSVVHKGRGAVAIPTTYRILGTSLNMNQVLQVQLSANVEVDEKVGEGIRQIR